ncbi:hypothetical protein KEM54_005934 [Ascosphaera aggregata]|nr:hypothetical protein KEM54_005934 [Ascosphaera aggregata]
MTTPTESELQSLFAKAIQAKEHAYVPYSNFHVGCCVLTISGDFITGCNVENAAYPVGICAEKNAIGTAVAAGHRAFKALAVSSDISPPASPCGNCRQFIREFAAPDFPVYMVDNHGKSTLMTIGKLLPGAFGPESLPGQTPN